MGCGNRLLAAIYFFSYLVIITLIFLNLFVAIILNGYFDTRDQESHSLNGEVLGVFKESWAKFDPDATGYIKESYFTHLMFDIGSPMGWDESYRDNKEQQNSFSVMAKRTANPSEDGLFFNDILDNIA